MTNKASAARRMAYLAREWIHTYIWTKEKMATTPYGFKMVSPSYSANRQMLTGEFEKDEVAVLKKYLVKDTLFVDVGANIGFYTLFALAAGHSVIAIEPKPSNAKVLVRNLFINNFVSGECQFCPVGVGERHSIMPLYGATGTAASLLKGWAGHSDKIKEHIPISTLDSLLSNISVGKKILIKIDVEGAEYDVVKGALSTLKRDDATWLVEICFDEYFGGG